MTNAELKSYKAKIIVANDIARKINGLEKFLKMFNDKSKVRIEIDNHCYPVLDYELFCPYKDEEKEMLQSMCFSFLRTHFESKLAKLKEEFEKMEVKLETNF